MPLKQLSRTSKRRAQSQRGYLLAERPSVSAESPYEFHRLTFKQFHSEASAVMRASSSGYAAPKLKGTVHTKSNQS
jgi:hypothetical protein